MQNGIDIKELNVSFNGKCVLEDIHLQIPPGKVTAIIGPSGCGKTTLLRCLNRLSELTRGCKVEGEILLDGQNILRMDPISLRRKVGMVFQKPNPFPMSVRENILYGLKANGNHRNHNGNEVVKQCLTKSALWDELKDRLKDNAGDLSLGQQQRLCIARSLAVSPEVMLMDEPAASLDPVSTTKLEETIAAMKGEYTQIIVTHNMQQAQRVSDYVAFIYLGRVIEFNAADKIFNEPEKPETRAYIAGKMG
jgi:phosphate transport system ATP-binding protein